MNIIRKTTSAAAPAPLRRPPVSTADWLAPWVQLKYFSFNPCIYPAMIRAASPDAKAGDLVTVYDKEGRRFGAGLFNPRARVPLRVIYHGDETFTEAHFDALLDRALDLRLNRLQLPQQTDAFRVINSDGDSLSGLVVDKFGDVLSVEVHSLGVYQRLEGWLKKLHAALGTKRQIIEVDDRVASYERIRHQPPPSSIRTVRIQEHGIKFEVDFATGHKTGFFCDQRDNRIQVRPWAKGARVLDLCCYTGGFALNAACHGALEVTGVDLDEKAISQARRNANLNQVRLNLVHCDAFTYARQMQQNGQQWDLVVLDPPKLVENREEEELGRRKYEDLNSLAATLVKPGGLLATCSCSGLLEAENFEFLVVRGIHRMSRRLQILDRTGASPDHPMMSNATEGRYLKVIWARIF
jgi:23S rRNA (cytosine1962-C5)-methyltransferase